jgi:hypothetical protein
MNKLIAVTARLENPRPKKALPFSLTKRVFDGIEAQLQSNKRRMHNCLSSVPIHRTAHKSQAHIRCLCRNRVGIQPFLSRRLFRGFQLQKRMGGFFNSGYWFLREGMMGQGYKQFWSVFLAQFHDEEGLASRSRHLVLQPRAKRA